MDVKAVGQWQESGSTKACFDPSPRTNSAVVNGEGSPTLRKDRLGKSYHPWMLIGSLIPMKVTQDY